MGKDARNGTILDYGQLIYVTLQRAATAREAIATMHELTTKCGPSTFGLGLGLGLGLARSRVRVAPSC